MRCPYGMVCLRPLEALPLPNKYLIDYHGIYFTRHPLLNPLAVSPCRINNSSKFKISCRLVGRQSPKSLNSTGTARWRGSCDKPYRTKLGRCTPPSPPMPGATAHHQTPCLQETTGRLQPQFSVQINVAHLALTDFHTASKPGTFVTPEAMEWLDFKTMADGSLDGVAT